jgi:hypothetical protein
MKVPRIDTPAEFFRVVVETDVAEFEANQTDLRLAYHSCISLLSFRDWVFNTHKNKHWMYYGLRKRPFNKATDLQDTLEAENKSFSVVADVANTIKHMVRTDQRRMAKPAIVETPSIINIGALGLQGLNGEMLNGDRLQYIEEWIAVEIDNQTFDLYFCVVAVRDVWRFLIRENAW